MTRRSTEALGVAEVGLAVNPNFVPLYNTCAIAKNSLGRFEHAKADVQRAMRLSPRDPFVGTFHLSTGSAELGLGNLEAAIDAYRKALDVGYSRYRVHAMLAAAYAKAGRMDDAKVALTEARRQNPQFTVKWWIGHFANQPAVLDGLRKAGLPEE
jgi:tetratricopeptide (TPR) repeat protein